MDDKVPKLPKYVFRRPNGSYRYKRNVPKDLRSVIPKQTLYRQLGRTYDEMVKRLPLVHSEIEALFDLEKRTLPSERALRIVQERIGGWKADAFEQGAIEYGWDIYEEFDDLAFELEGRIPENVHEQIANASMLKEAYSLKSALDDYYAFKCPKGEENRDLRNRTQRLSEYLLLCLGKVKFQTRKIDELKRSDANALRDYLLKLMSPNSVVRNIGVVKAALNYAIREHDLDIRNVFEGLIVQGSGAGKSDRLPMSDEDLLALEAKCKEIEPASAILTVLTDTGARLGEVVGLEVRDVDLEEGALHIRPNSIRRLKTKSSERSVPLSPRSKSKLIKFMENTADSEPVFTKYARQRGSDAASAMMMKHVRKITDDKKITLHSLRHRMKDKLRNSGCPEHLSMAILGHSSNSVAANYGSGYAKDVMREALQKVWETKT